MEHPLVQLRLAAINIDGVLLNDTFSPVLRRYLERRGAAYTAQVERRLFSQPRELVGRLFVELTGEAVTPQEAMAAYFTEREEYLRSHPVVVDPGAVGLLERLRALGLRTVCYGGLARGHFDAFLGAHRELFDDPGYVCTDAIRPGVHEIVTEHFDLKYDQALFIDDVARMADATRALGVAFVGHPSRHPDSHQARMMRESGVRHVVDSLAAIDEPLLRVLDAEAAAGVRTA
ncbi:HAD family phosphatase [Streptantibioticus silvisoli]|uniref:HAD family phosphatase n=1 Tax=Streptantibioticus silvisoli TaxID=2705255 RepID=A0ABT6W8C0_9ACTN|nr:HAD family phosphatase [Streptantibioticus silvisoli]MDI5966998.1 HAD family phosphatase [Streptantibioticus silvisoli]